MQKYLISPTRYNIEVQQLLQILQQMFHPTPTVDTIADFIAIKYGYKSKQHFLENAKKFNNDSYVWYMEPMKPYAHDEDSVSDAVRKWMLQTEDALIIHNDAVNQEGIDPVVFLVGVINEMMQHIDDALAQDPQLKSVWTITSASHYVWEHTWDEKVLLIQDVDKTKREKTSTFLLRGANEVQTLELDKITSSPKLTKDFINAISDCDDTNSPTIRVEISSTFDAEKLYPLLLSSSITEARWLIELTTKNISETATVNLTSMVDRLISLG